MMTTLPPYALLRLPRVLELRGVGKTKHYDDIEAGLFTRGVDLGHIVVWPEGEIRALNLACIAGKPGDEIRALVLELESARAQAA